MTDHYTTLGIDESASQDEITNAFREKVKQYHPDHNDDPRAEKQFSRIKEAYDVLSDPDARASYDATGCSVDGESQTETGQSSTSSNQRTSETHSTQQSSYVMGRDGFKAAVTMSKSTSNMSSQKQSFNLSQFVGRSIAFIFPFLIAISSVFHVIAVGGRAYIDIPLLTSILPPVVAPVPLVVVPVAVFVGVVGSILVSEEITNPDTPIKRLLLGRFG